MTNLLQPAENTAAFLKMGITGFQGSGKTHTSVSIAIGLALHMRKLGLPAGNRPIGFFDTETGSNWVKKRINAAGIELINIKSRAYADLLGTIDEAEKSCSVLVIDSITHIWREFVQAYQRAKKRNYLKFEDWSQLKGEDGWQRFTDKFINSNLHVIFAGRAGYEFDMDTDEETGKKTLEKTGIKLRAEGETGYEPDLFVLMERKMDMKTKADAHIAHVLKDRSTLLDGQEFAEPTFATFWPHIECLNLGGKQLGIDTSRTSDHIIKLDGRDNRPLQRRIAVDEIQTLLVLHIPGQAAADKKRKVELIRKHFNNAAWTEIEEAMPLPDLRAGYDTLHLELEGKPSRYHPAVLSAAAPAKTLAEDLDDGLPEHSAAPIVPAPKLPKVVNIPIKQDNDADDDIPVFLQRKKPTHADHHDDVLAEHASASAPPMIPASIKGKLLRDIPLLSSVSECLQWGLEMSPKFDTLSVKDKKEVYSALAARQVAFLNGSGLHA